MKNISSLQKNNKSESPKTPGGISKSLLTPCRRVGLSRNWRKSGPSPFISPLSGTDSNNEPKQQQESRKRKSIKDQTSKEASENNDKSEDFIETQTADANRTPIRSLLPRKKSKTLLLAKKYEGESENVPEISSINSDEKVESITSETKKNSKNTNSTVIESKTDSPSIKVIKLSRTNSKSNFKIIKSPIKEQSDEPSKVNNKVCAAEDNNESTKIECKQKSPDNLTKECIVVIQNKILKSNKKADKLKPKENLTSQVIFDSDSDDVPLSDINKKEKEITSIVINEDDEFQESTKVQKLQHKTTSTSELKTKDTKQKSKPLKNKTKPKIQAEAFIKSSQESIDLDDDDFVANKRTILIKKTYDKTQKLSKSKSTGAITQKDIDELKERIEAKKNLFLAKAITNETAELRSLIKKWQKGCQTALTELLELMKTKMPEQQNMEYSEILQLLKIPPDLVGFDSENDCFVTPDDANIVLSGFNIE